MITITKKEEYVLNEIKALNLEYSEGIPQNILKMQLGITEHELNDILSELNKKKTIDYSHSKIRYLKNKKEISSVETKKEVKTAEINEKEEKTLEIIKKLINDDKIVSKYILEGYLLYGDLKLSNLRMYKILLSLEKKGIIKKLLKTDGKFYKLNI
ncbi:hypothetical protein [Methanobrevibacter curvatus]|uniref:Uncharacterized protein n=1 Tax=Methanobrevibacter curvatus TaxID=49547 RepID=A0A166B076_9EURY|nr:hypothetical protein [Methanobrevibacter curvatus]KZX12698.1 hypothetical protein MBCUR_09510 [Methanobrevibacter curvatus]